MSSSSVDGELCKTRTAYCPTCCISTLNNTITLVLAGPPSNIALLRQLVGMRQPVILWVLSGLKAVRSVVYQIGKKSLGLNDESMHTVSS
jgi:hypothetical protein